MTKRFWAAGLLLAAVVIGCGSRGEAQSVPTATQTLELSVFGAGTGTYTGLFDGRNAGITAGIDLSFPTYHHFRPAVELRGNAPFNKGDVDSQKSVLIGPRVTRAFGRFHPYADGFFGRGEFNYLNGGIIINNFRYDRTTTNVFAGGGGLDFRVTQHFDLKADAQYERWKTPVISTGVVYAKPLSLGVVYHLDFNQYHRPKRHKVRPVVEPVPSAGYVGPPTGVPSN